MYSRRVLEQFENPKHAGELADAEVRVRVENPACGDILELFLKTAGDRIADARFRVRGCVAAVACAAQLTEMIIGRPIKEAGLLRKEQLIAALDGLPEASGHSAQLAVDGLRAALKDIETRPFHPGGNDSTQPSRGG